MIQSSQTHRKRLHRWLPALVLLVLAAIFRFPGLDAAPPALFRDEVEKGYTAWELAGTARYGKLDLETGACRGTRGVVMGNLRGVAVTR